ncbi:ARM repeat-containing protein [Punctularia strigosozonata HHB-11173 SS5]|uniref:ARM repeat-containing protein n=1 Tax=Punctularia strigosozonata (strain HHB-11173) TaxID=741275 RepID=UPI0004416551|nr:ARM repeat-containing protein [Punctularia strigosozonata HHB-11173 SS5]EIN10324.1 ARM repeat-containing protein [Punctularia strigosozonata HHB-11173 SS5]
MNKSSAAAATAAVETVNPQDVYTVMCAAASQDPIEMQRASTSLILLLEKFGTYDALQEIAATKSVPLPVRQQSMIQFKNAVNNHWRSRKYLSDEHRVRIRQRCLTAFLTEEDDMIADTNEVVVQKIARADFPRNWPNLITDLANVVAQNMHVRYSSSASDPVVYLALRRSLSMVNKVLKEIASGKLPQHHRAMTQIVTEVHQPFLAHYSAASAHFGSALTATGIGLPRTLQDLTLAHLIFKCLVKMTAWVWNRPGSPSDELARLHASFFSSAARRLQELSETRIALVGALAPAPNANAARAAVDRLTRHVRLFGKCFRRFQQLGAQRFIGLPYCNDLVLYYWSKVVQAANGPPELIADSNEAVFPVRFLVQAMVLFKGNLSEWTPVKRNGTPNEHVLSQQFVEDAVRLLVTQYIPLKPADLEGWLADPEQWVNDEDKETDYWEYELRPCAERVLLTLANQYKQYVVPMLQTTFNQVIATPTPDLPSIIQKEAVYCAIGRCAHRLRDVIPFGQWLEQSLLPDSRDTNPNYPIIKRRIAWVIGKFVADQCVPAKDPKIWDVLVHLLEDRQAGTDSVVRLTAAIAIQEAVDSIDFDPNVFEPYLQTAVTELLRLTSEVDSLESKRRVAQSLNVVIERVEERIVPLISMITAPLPALWNESASDWLFKTSLLLTVTKLIESAKAQSTPLAPLVVPLIQECFSVPETRLHLEEDALVLMQAALSNTLTIQSMNGAPALIDLFPILIPYIAGDIHILGRVTNLIESYFVADAPAILQGYGTELFQAFREGLAGHATTLNKRDMVAALALLTQFSQSAQWGPPMHASGLFAYILEQLVDEEANTTLAVEYVYLVARMVLSDVRMFEQLMSATAASLNAPNRTESHLYDALVGQWWNKFDNISEPRYRKLSAMGIAVLVATGRPEVLDHLAFEIFNLWLDVFGEIKEGQQVASLDSESSHPVLYWDQDAMPFSYVGAAPEGSPEYERRKAVYDSDVVRTTQLTPFVAERLREAEAACGGTQIMQTRYLVKADPTVLKQIQDELMGLRP